MNPENTKANANETAAQIADLQPAEATTDSVTGGHSGGVNVLMGDGSVRFIR